MNPGELHSKSGGGLEVFISAYFRTELMEGLELIILSTFPIELLNCNENIFPDNRSNPYFGVTPLLVLKRDEHQREVLQKQKFQGWFTEEK